MSKPSRRRSHSARRSSERGAGKYMRIGDDEDVPAVSRDQRAEEAAQDVPRRRRPRRNDKGALSVGQDITKGVFDTGLHIVTLGTFITAVALLVIAGFVIMFVAAVPVYLWDEHHTTAIKHGVMLHKGVLEPLSRSVILPVLNVTEQAYRVLIPVWNFGVLLPKKWTADVVTELLTCPAIWRVGGLIESVITALYRVVVWIPPFMLDVLRSLLLQHVEDFSFQYMVPHILDSVGLVIANIAATVRCICGLGSIVFDIIANTVVNNHLQCFIWNTITLILRAWRVAGATLIGTLGVVIQGIGCIGHPHNCTVVFPSQFRINVSEANLLFDNADAVACCAGNFIDDVEETMFQTVDRLLAEIPEANISMESLFGYPRTGGLVRGTVPLATEISRVLYHWAMGSFDEHDEVRMRDTIESVAHELGGTIDSQMPTEARMVTAGMMIASRFTIDVIVLTKEFLDRNSSESFYQVYKDHNWDCLLEPWRLFAIESGRFVDAFTTSIPLPTKVEYAGDMLDVPGGRIYTPIDPIINWDFPVAFNGEPGHFVASEYLMMAEGLRVLLTFTQNFDTFENFRSVDTDCFFESLRNVSHYSSVLAGAALDGISQPILLPFELHFNETLRLPTTEAVHATEEALNFIIEYIRVFERVFKNLTVSSDFPYLDFTHVDVDLLREQQRRFAEAFGELGGMYNNSFQTQDMFEAAAMAIGEILVLPARGMRWDVMRHELFDDFFCAVNNFALSLPGPLEFTTFNVTWNRPESAAYVFNLGDPLAGAGVTVARAGWFLNRVLISVINKIYEEASEWDLAIDAANETLNALLYFDQELSYVPGLIDDSLQESVQGGINGLVALTRFLVLSIIHPQAVGENYYEMRAELRCGLQELAVGMGSIAELPFEIINDIMLAINSSDADGPYIEKVIESAGLFGHTLTRLPAGLLDVVVNIGGTLIDMHNITWKTDVKESIDNLRCLFDELGWRSNEFISALFDDNLCEIPAAFEAIFNFYAALFDQVVFLFEDEKLILFYILNRVSELAMRLIEAGFALPINVLRQFENWFPKAELLQDFLESVINLLRVLDNLLVKLADFAVTLPRAIIKFIVTFVGEIVYDIGVARSVHSHDPSSPGAIAAGTEARDDFFSIFVDFPFDPSDADAINYPFLEFFGDLAIHFSHVVEAIAEIFNYFGNGISGFVGEFFHLIRDMLDQLANIMRIAFTKPGPIRDMMIALSDLLTGLIGGIFTTLFGHPEWGTFLTGALEFFQALWEIIKFFIVDLIGTLIDDTLFRGFTFPGGWPPFECVLHLPKCICAMTTGWLQHHCDYNPTRSTRSTVDELKIMVSEMIEYFNEVDHPGCYAFLTHVLTAQDEDIERLKIRTSIRITECYANRTNEMNQEILQRRGIVRSDYLVNITSTPIANEMMETMLINVIAGIEAYDYMQVYYKLYADSGVTLDTFIVMNGIVDEDVIDVMKRINVIIARSGEGTFAAFSKYFPAELYASRQDYKAMQNVAAEQVEFIRSLFDYETLYGLGETELVTRDTRAARDHLFWERDPSESMASSSEYSPPTPEPDPYARFNIIPTLGGCEDLNPNGGVCGFDSLQCKQITAGAACPIEFPNCTNGNYTRVIPFPCPSSKCRQGNWHFSDGWNQSSTATYNTYFCPSLCANSAKRSGSFYSLCEWMPWEGNIEFYNRASRYYIDTESKYSGFYVLRSEESASDGSVLAMWNLFNTMATFGTATFYDNYFITMPNVNWECQIIAETGMASRDFCVETCNLQTVSGNRGILTEYQLSGPYAARRQLCDDFCSDRGHDEYCQVDIGTGGFPCEQARRHVGLNEFQKQQLLIPGIHLDGEREWISCDTVTGTCESGAALCGQYCFNDVFRDAPAILNLMTTCPFQFPTVCAREQSEIYAMENNTIAGGEAPCVYPYFMSDKILANAVAPDGSNISSITQPPLLDEATARYGTNDTWVVEYEGPDYSNVETRRNVMPFICDWILGTPGAFHELSLPNVEPGPSISWIYTFFDFLNLATSALPPQVEVRRGYHMHPNMTVTLVSVSTCLHAGGGYDNVTGLYEDYRYWCQDLCCDEHAENCDCQTAFEGAHDQGLNCTLFMGAYASETTTPQECAQKALCEAMSTLYDDGVSLHPTLLPYVPREIFENFTVDAFPLISNGRRLSDPVLGVGTSFASTAICPAIDGSLLGSPILGSTTSFACYMMAPQGPINLHYVDHVKGVDFADNVTCKEIGYHLTEYNQLSYSYFNDSYPTWPEPINGTEYFGVHRYGGSLWEAEDRADNDTVCPLWSCNYTIPEPLRCNYTDIYPVYPNYTGRYDGFYPGAIPGYCVERFTCSYDFKTPCQYVRNLTRIPSTLEIQTYLDTFYGSGGAPLTRSLHTLRAHARTLRVLAGPQLDIIERADALGIPIRHIITGMVNRATCDNFPSLPQCRNYNDWKTSLYRRDVIVSDESGISDAMILAKRYHGTVDVDYYQSRRPHLRYTSPSFPTLYRGARYHEIDDYPYANYTLLFTDENWEQDWSCWVVCEYDYGDLMRRACFEDIFSIFDDQEVTDTALEVVDDLAAIPPTLCRWIGMPTTETTHFARRSPAQARLVRGVGEFLRNRRDIILNVTVSNTTDRVNKYYPDEDAFSSTFGHLVVKKILRGLGLDTPSHSRTVMETIGRAILDGWSGKLTEEGDFELPFNFSNFDDFLTNTNTDPDLGPVGLLYYIELYGFCNCQNLRGDPTIWGMLQYTPRCFISPTNFGLITAPLPINLVAFLRDTIQETILNLTWLLPPGTYVNGTETECFTTEQTEVMFSFDETNPCYDIQIYDYRTKGFTSGKTLVTFPPHFVSGRFARAVSDSKYATRFLRVFGFKNAWTRFDEYHNSTEKDAYAAMYLWASPALMGHLVAELWVVATGILMLMGMLIVCVSVCKVPRPAIAALLMLGGLIVFGAIFFL